MSCYLCRAPEQFVRHVESMRVRGHPVLERSNCIVMLSCGAHNLVKLGHVCQVVDTGMTGSSPTISLLNDTFISHGTDGNSRVRRTSQVDVASSWDDKSVYGF